MTRLSAGRTPAELLERYVDDGPGIVADLEKRTPLRLKAMSWPDYHPEMAGAKATGRMLEPELFDTGRLGVWAQHLRRPPVLGLPLTLQEATVEWRPTYHPGAVRCRRGGAAGGQPSGGLWPGPDRRAARGLPGAGDRADVGDPGVRDRHGRRDSVVGLVAEHAGRRSEIAAGAVVLATGGYEWNADLRTRFLPGPLTHPHSPPANQGDGLLMAMDIGADLANMNETWWYPASRYRVRSTRGGPWPGSSASSEPHPTRSWSTASGSASSTRRPTTTT